MVHLDMDLSSRPADILSRMLEGSSIEDRRAKMNAEFTNVERKLADTKRKLDSTKETIEENRVKHENMNDTVRTMEQLKRSLEEHIKTVRLNESSFAGTSAVLEYDTAKGRTNKLINVIKARVQWERAKEALEGAEEDQTRMYEGLADMQNSQDTLSKIVGKVFDNKDLEDKKDRFLAWQSAALIFAIQQADFDRLSEVQKTYESLGRKDEFISIFRRVSINRLKEFNLDTTSVQLILDGLYKEVEFVFGHHQRVLRRFLNDEETAELLVGAIDEGLKEIDLASPLAQLVGGEENPIELLQKIAKLILVRAEPSTGSKRLEDVCTQLSNRVVDELVRPFRGALTTYVLSKINTIDLVSGSFRSRVDSLKTSVADLIHLLHDIFVNAEGLFGEKTKLVVQQPIDRALENFFAKLKNWEYWLDGQKKNRSIDDLMSVCGASGQLVFGLQEFKSLVENSYPTLSPNLKAALKWNRGVCDNTLKIACEKVTIRMKTSIQEIHASVTPDTPASNLPAFSTSPHEYVTTAAQELLQLFHRWEQFFLDDNVSMAFFIAFKKRYEGEELFKKTIADVGNRVMSDFISSIGQPATLHKNILRQFLADTVFLKDAFEDLRTGNIEDLATLEEKLRTALKG